MSEMCNDNAIPIYYGKYSVWCKHGHLTRLYENVVTFKVHFFGAFVKHISFNPF